MGEPSSYFLISEYEKETQIRSCVVFQGSTLMLNILSHRPLDDVNDFGASDIGLPNRSCRLGCGSGDFF